MFGSTFSSTASARLHSQSSLNISSSDQQNLRVKSRRLVLVLLSE